MGMADGRWASDKQMDRIEREQKEILASRKAAGSKSAAPKGGKKK